MTTSSVENDDKSHHNERLSFSSNTTPRSSDEDHPVEAARHDDNGTEHHENVVVIVQERTTYQHRRNENDDAPTTSSLWKIHEVWHSDGSYQQTQRRIEDHQAEDAIPDIFPVAQATPLPEATAELATEENSDNHRPQDSGSVDSLPLGSDQNTVASLVQGRMNTFHVVQVDEEQAAAATLEEGDGSIHSHQDIAITTRVHVDEEVAPLPPNRELRCCCIKTTERRLRHPCCLCSLALLTIFLIILMIVLIGYGVWAGTDKD